MNLWIRRANFVLGCRSKIVINDPLSLAAADGLLKKYNFQSYAHFLCDMNNIYSDPFGMDHWLTELAKRRKVDV